ncbi:hypothetical protein F5X99DRAFT_390403 [Biscogniauxia marginata]|nr:hypothetical protein F5X99DRAFT_390403 [Biscogniauxia marginata]
MPNMDMAAISRPEVKRRKIRKGTHSCWSCKRRKVRCVYRSPDDAVCIGCRSRGTDCISQEFSEEDVSLLSSSEHQMVDRMVRVEAISKELARSPASPNISEASTGGRDHPGSKGGIETPINGIPTPTSCQSGHSGFSALREPLPESLAQQPVSTPVLTTSPSQPHHGLNRENEPGLNRYKGLSRALYDALPSREDVELICQAGGRISVYLTQHMRMAQSEIDRGGFEDVKQKLQNRPGHDAHPVSLAKYMLSLATFLQYLHPECHHNIKDLSEPPRTMMQRLAETAISLTTTNDELLGSVEGLECVIMEGTFHANIGNLRRAWLAFRRALGLAQMMGIHRAGRHQKLNFIDPNNTEIDTRIMWFRIVYVDRFLCLMLGLPQGSLDESFASESALRGDTHVGQLERIHCVLASRILRRNDSDGFGNDDYDTTRDIDVELQKAANRLPDKWWLTPNLAGVDDQAVFQETLRLVQQMFHYNLLNQLHLPYMLQFDSTADTAEARCRHDYARLTCVNASRELLNRFIVFRSFNRVAFCCRSVDFFALMAGMTLLLAHLDSHRQDRTHRFAGNFLAHQRSSDRAMIEQALENMTEVSRLNHDALSQESAQLLRRVLAIEVEASEGSVYRAERVTAPETDPVHFGDEKHTLCMQIPYFGLIKITHEGTISRGPPPEVPPQQCQLSIAGSFYSPSTDGDTTMTTCTSNTDITSPIQTNRTIHPGLSSLHRAPDTPRQEGNMDNGFSQHLPEFSAANEFLGNQYPCPGLTASADDWAFQGVDLAFFDNLMRGASVEGIGDGNGQWANW